MATVSLQNVVKHYLTDGQRVRALHGLSLEQTSAHRAHPIALKSDA
jgi:hypothetical protein